MRTLDFLSLSLFVSVVELGNIAHAARVNGIAASAVSKRITDLEARMGVELLHRLREGVKPTQAGRALYDHARKIAQSVERLQAEVSEFSSGERGSVRLWANTSAVTQFLPEDLKLYLDQRPAVTIELREDTSHRIVEAVRDGIADIGIYSSHIGHGSLERRIYRRDTLMVIVPRGHPLEGRGSVQLADLVGFDHVGLQEGSSLQARIREAAQAQHRDIHFRVHVFGFDGIRRMVEAGLGISILPQGAVLPYADLGHFAALTLAEPWAERTLYIGYREYQALPLVARLLVETLAPNV